jgi:peptidoglycan hydrolase CwlO-like protein
MDPEVQDLLNQCHELQRQFVDAHKEVDKTRKTSKDPVKLKERIAELEQDKEQVTSPKPYTLNPKP